jgi:hypothetical protein
MILRESNNTKSKSIKTNFALKLKLVDPLNKVNSLLNFIQLLQNHSNKQFKI